MDEAGTRPIHVAGVLDESDALTLVESGVRHIGIPLVPGHHAEDLGVEQAKAVVAALGHRSEFFLITYLDRAAAIEELCRDLMVDTVQLHGTVGSRELWSLRESWPELHIIKSLIVRDSDPEPLIDEIRDHAPVVNAFITDTFDPSTGACGATGKTHDWEVSRQLVLLSPKPVILAGGLTAGNVRDAIATVRPAGVDVHSGVEGEDGRKSRELAGDFVAAARSAFADLEGAF